MKDIKLSHDELLAALGRKIPGFTGYRDREQRRDADRLQRENLAKTTSTLKQRVQDVQEELLSKGDMKLMGRLGQTSNRLDKITERLRHANHGYSGFYDERQIDADELTAVYEFDLNLYNDLDQAAAQVTELRQNPGPETAAALEQGLQELDAKLDARERLLRGVS